MDDLTEWTYTIIGTPHFMAPEMFDEIGYTFYVDFWSIGITLYEILEGCLPFGD